MGNDPKAQTTISKKLWLLSIGMLANLVFMGFVANWNSTNLINQLNNVGETQLPAVRNMTLVDMMHDGIRANVFHAIIVSGSDDPKEKEDVLKELEEFTGNINKYLKDIEALNIREETRTAIKPAVVEIAVYAESAHKIVNVALSGNRSGAIAMIPEFQKSFESLEEKLEKLGELVEADAQQEINDGHDLEKKASVLGWGVVVAGVFLGLLISFLNIRSLQNTLRQITIGLSSEAHKMTGSSSSLMETSENLSHSVKQQGVSLQSTASSLVEITAMLKKTSENVEELHQNTGASQAAATRGQEAVDEMINSIHTIGESNSRIMQQVEEGNKKISEIVKVIGEIGTKTKVINDIVFQTKLLSFNASVEAARAGEHGKGFAVVAEEVGKLAQMSGKSAKEISDLLDSSLHRVNEIVSENQDRVKDLVETGKDNLSMGTSVVEKCKVALDEIVRMSSQVAKMVEESVAAIQEQQVGVTEISKAVNDLEQVTDKNSAIASATHSSSKSLQEQATSLANIIATLEALVSKNSLSAEEGLGADSSTGAEPPASGAGSDNVVSVDFKQGRRSA